MLSNDDVSSSFSDTISADASTSTRSSTEHTTSKTDYIPKNGVNAFSDSLSGCSLFDLCSSDAVKAANTNEISSINVTRATSSSNLEKPILKRRSVSPYFVQENAMSQLQKSDSSGTNISNKKFDTNESKPDKEMISLRALAFINSLAVPTTTSATTPEDNSEHMLGNNSKPHVNFMSSIDSGISSPMNVDQNKALSTISRTSITISDMVQSIDFDSSVPTDVKSNIRMSDASLQPEAIDNNNVSPQDISIKPINSNSNNNTVEQSGCALPAIKLESTEFSANNEVCKISTSTLAKEHNPEHSNINKLPSTTKEPNIISTATSSKKTNIYDSYDNFLPERSTVFRRFSIANCKDKTKMNGLKNNVELSTSLVRADEVLKREPRMVRGNIVVTDYIDNSYITDAPTLQPELTSVAPNVASFMANDNVIDHKLSFESVLPQFLEASNIKKESSGNIYIMSPELKINTNNPDNKIVNIDKTQQMDEYLIKEKMAVDRTYSGELLTAENEQEKTSASNDRSLNSNCKENQVNKLENIVSDLIQPRLQSNEHSSIRTTHADLNQSKKTEKPSASFESFKSEKCVEKYDRQRKSSGDRPFKDNQTTEYFDRRKSTTEPYADKQSKKCHLLSSHKFSDPSVCVKSREFGQKRCSREKRSSIDTQDDDESSPNHRSSYSFLPSERSDILSSKNNGTRTNHQDVTDDHIVERSQVRRSIRSSSRLHSSSDNEVQHSSRRSLRSDSRRQCISSNVNDENIAARENRCSTRDHHHNIRSKSKNTPTVSCEIVLDSTTAKRRDSTFKSPVHEKSRINCVNGTTKTIRVIPVEQRSLDHPSTSANTSEMNEDQPQLSVNCKRLHDILVDDIDISSSVPPQPNITHANQATSSAFTLYNDSKNSQSQTSENQTKEISTYYAVSEQSAISEPAPKILVRPFPELSAICDQSPNNDTHTKPSVVQNHNSIPRTSIIKNVTKYSQSLLKSDSIQTHIDSISSASAHKSRNDNENGALNLTIGTPVSVGVVDNNNTSSASISSASTGVISPNSIQPLKTSSCGRRTKPIKVQKRKKLSEISELIKMSILENTVLAKQMQQFPDGDLMLSIKCVEALSQPEPIIGRTSEKEPVDIRTKSNSSNQQKTPEDACNISSVEPIVPASLVSDECIDGKNGCVKVEVRSFDKIDFIDVACAIEDTITANLVETEKPSLLNIEEPKPSKPEEPNSLHIEKTKPLKREETKPSKMEEQKPAKEVSQPTRITPARRAKFSTIEKQNEDNAFARTKRKRPNVFSAFETIKHAKVQDKTPEKATRAKTAGIVLSTPPSNEKRSLRGNSKRSRGNNGLLGDEEMNNIVYSPNTLLDNTTLEKRKSRKSISISGANMDEMSSAKKYMKNDMESTISNVERMPILSPKKAIFRAEQSFELQNSMKASIPNGHPIDMTPTKKTTSEEPKYISPLVMKKTFEYKCSSDRDRILKRIKQFDSSFPSMTEDGDDVISCITENIPNDYMETRSTLIKIKKIFYSRFVKWMKLCIGESRSQHLQMMEDKLNSLNQVISFDSNIFDDINVWYSTLKDGHKATSSNNQSFKYFDKFLKWWWRKFKCYCTPVQNRKYSNTFYDTEESTSSDSNSNTHERDELLRKFNENRSDHQLQHNAPHTDIISNSPTDFHTVFSKTNSHHSHNEFNGNVSESSIAETEDVVIDSVAKITQLSKKAETVANAQHEMNGSVSQKPAHISNLSLPIQIATKSASSPYEERTYSIADLNEAVIDQLSQSPKLFITDPDSNANIDAHSTIGVYLLSSNDDSMSTLSLETNSTTTFHDQLLQLRVEGDKADDNLKQLFTPECNTISMYEEEAIIIPELRDSSNDALNALAPQKIHEILLQNEFDNYGDDNIFKQYNREYGLGHPTDPTMGIAKKSYMDNPLPVEEAVFPLVDNHLISLTNGCDVCAPLKEILDPSKISKKDNSNKTNSENSYDSIFSNPQAPSTQSIDNVHESSLGNTVFNSLNDANPSLIDIEYDYNFDFNYFDMMNIKMATIPTNNMQKAAREEEHVVAPSANVPFTIENKENTLQEHNRNDKAIPSKSAKDAQYNHEPVFVEEKQALVETQADLGFQLTKINFDDIIEYVPEVTASDRNHTDEDLAVYAQEISSNADDALAGNGDVNGLSEYNTFNSNDIFPKISEPDFESAKSLIDEFSFKRPIPYDENKKSNLYPIKNKQVKTSKRKLPNDKCNNSTRKYQPVELNDTVNHANSSSFLVKSVNNENSIEITDGNTTPSEVNGSKIIKIQIKNLSSEDKSISKMYPVVSSEKPYSPNIVVRKGRKSHSSKRGGHSIGPSNQTWRTQIHYN